MKLLLIYVLLFISINTFSQPFIGLQVSNKGVGAQIGVKIQHDYLLIAIKSPLYNNEVPVIKSFSYGHEFLLSNYEDDNYSVTPFIGIAQYKLKQIDDIPEYKRIVPIYTLELAKKYYAGQVFVSGTYCKSTYFSIGIRIFPTLL